MVCLRNRAMAMIVPALACPALESAVWPVRSTNNNRVRYADSHSRTSNAALPSPDATLEPPLSVQKLVFRLLCLTFPPSITMPSNHSSLMLSIRHNHAHHASAHPAYTATKHTIIRHPTPPDSGETTGMEIAPGDPTESRSGYLTRDALPRGECSANNAR